MSRAFVYCHVSTEEQSQDDHYSLALQEERCRDYAKAKSWRITKVRKDVGSGRNGDRPGFQELLQDVSAGAIDVVIVYRLDRLSRNVRDVYDFLERTRQADVGFVSTSEAFDTTTAMGRAMLGVAAVFSQLTREVIGENTRDGMAKRARSGKYTGSAGNPPYGHSYSTAEGKLLVEPAEAGVVRQVFDLYGHRKWGYMKIAQHLNQEGIPPRMEGAQWSPRRVAAMLRSPVYVGKLPYRGKVYDGEQEPIIDQSLFDEVQVLLASRRQLPPRSQQSQHLLSGIARCGQCGERLRAHWI
ncbi:MAG: recombinase family protein, partial [Armatimonadetes bacterium]|nr:recombinase family protein [Armatimonadota bacterium]